MPERYIFPEMFLATSKEVQDTLAATNRVLAKRHLTTPPVRFVQDSTLNKEYETILRQTMAVVNDFDKRGLPTDIFKSGISYGLTMETETGPEIHLNANYFGDKLSQNKGRLIFPAYIIRMFTVIAQETLRANTQEVELTRKPEDLQLFVSMLMGTLNEIDSMLENSGKVSNYIAELQERLQSAPSLRVVGRGDLLVLKDDETIYSNELTKENIDSLVSMADFLSGSFIVQMKRTNWFIPPEEWPEQILREYVGLVKKIPKWPGGHDRYIVDYLSGEMARKNLEFLKTEVFKTETEPNVEVEIESTLQPPQSTEEKPEIPQQVLIAPVEVTVSPKKKKDKATKKTPKKKERKPKIYPKQRARLARLAAALLEEERREQFLSGKSLQVEESNEQDDIAELLKRFGHRIDSDQQESDQFSNDADFEFEDEALQTFQRIKKSGNNKGFAN